MTKIKINSMYKGSVTNIKESLLFLLSILPEKLKEIDKEINEEMESQKQEYEEWDEEQQKYITQTWYPNYYFPYLDYADVCFFGSMVQQIYSFAEIGLKTLSSKEYTSNIVFSHYNNIKKSQNIELKPLKEIWTHYDKFRKIRNELTHNTISSQNINFKFLEENVNQIADLLYYVENEVKKINPELVSKMIFQ